MRREGKWRTTAFTALALACGCSPGVDGHRLDETIQRELPIGSSRGAVVNFLEVHRIRVSDSITRKNHEGPRTVWGTITEGGWRWSWCDIDDYFTFEFGDGDRLTSYRLEQRPICP